MKKGLLKKGSSIALVTILIGSQLMTAVPFNVLAAENPAGTIGAQALPTYSVTVGTWPELKAALTSAAITDIYINADITIGETTSVTNTTKNIHGNDHTLNANGKQIKLATANTVGLIEDLRITNTDIYGLFWGSVANLEVTYKNVDHSGGQMIYLPYGHLIIDGTVTSISTTEEVYEGKDLTILDNATAYFATTSTARRNSPINSEAAAGKLIVGNNANLITRSKAASIYGGTNFTLINYGNMDLKSDNFQAIHLAVGSSMYFQPGSVLKAVAGDPVEEAVEATTGNIFVEAGATFEVESNGSQGAVITGDTFKLAEGSNFSITNFNPAGSAMGSYASAVNVILQSAQGVSTWDRGTVTNSMPTATYPGVINAQFTLSGYLKSVSQTKLTSNNALFNSRYNTGATGKIVGGSFSSKAIDQTTINKLDTDSTLATGTAEPKADVVIKVGSTIIGQGKAGDDGKYSITIPKQVVGANVTATATWNSQASSATAVVQKGTADQDAARTAVDALFTDATKTGIKSTTDQAAIDAAQALVNKVQDPTVKADLQKDIDKAQSLLDGQNEQAKQNTANTAVKELFTNNDPASNAIKDTTNQKAIDDAQKTIDVLAAGPVKTALQADLDKAQDLLDARTQQAADDQLQKAVATYAVNQLFVNNTPISDAIKASTDQDAIDSAQAEINKIKDLALKADLQKDLDRAQELLNQRNAANQAEQAKQDAARKAVNELFNSNTPASNAIKPTTTQATIDAAQRLIDTVTDPTTKAALQADLNKAQSLLDAKNAAAATEKAKQDAAKKAVDELFNSNTPTSGAIKPTTDQKAIDDAKKLVDAITDPAVKAERQADLNKAQDLLDAKNAAAATEKAKQDAAKKAVDELFNSNTPTSGAIKPTTDQKAIDDAKKLVDAITDPAVKAERQADLDKAQNLLDAKNTTLTAPKVNGYGVTDEYITGTVDANTVTVELYINGVRKKVSTPTNGDFKLYAQGFGLKVGDTFEVRGVDTKGNKGPIATGTVLSSSSSVAYGLTANDAGLSATTITGTAGSGLTTVRLSIDGTIVKVGQIKADGTYSISTNNLIKPGSKVEVVGYADKTEMARKTVNIVNDEKPTLEALTIDDDAVKGSVTAGSATGFRVSINGVAVKTGTIAANGTFQSSIGKQAVGTVVTIEIRDTTGYNTFRTASVTVTGSAVVKLTAPVLEKMDGNYIVGTAPKGTELITIYENGAAVRTQNVSAMTVNPDGSFAFKAYVAPSATSVQVQAKNSDKRMTSDLSTALTK